MAKITDSIRIDASKDKVWAILADFGGIINFNPGLRDSYSTSDANEGVGATRHCDLLPMGSIEERIIEWNEGKDYTIEVYQFDGPLPPFKEVIANLRIEADGNQTIATMTMEYDMKMGLIGVAMSQLMIKSQYKKAVAGILQGLKYHAETGNQSTRAALKAVYATA